MLATTSGHYEQQFNNAKEKSTLERRTPGESNYVLQIIWGLTLGPTCLLRAISKESHDHKKFSDDKLEPKSGQHKSTFKALDKHLKHPCIYYYIVLPCLAQLIP